MNCDLGSFPQKLSVVAVPHLLLEYMHTLVTYWSPQSLLNARFTCCIQFNVYTLYIRVAFSYFYSLSAIVFVTSFKNLKCMSIKHVSNYSPTGTV